MSRSLTLQTSFWRSSTIRISSRLSMSSMTIPASGSVPRREAEKVSDKDEPEESEARERKNCCIELVPDRPSRIDPGFDCVIKDHHSAYRAQNANELREVNPFVQVVIEGRDVRKAGDHDSHKADDEENVERNDELHGEPHSALLRGQLELPPIVTAHKRSDRP